MTENIVVAGFGGQGILFTGKLLSQAAVEEDKFTTFLGCFNSFVIFNIRQTFYHSLTPSPFLSYSKFYLFLGLIFYPPIFLLQFHQT